MLRHFFGLQHWNVSDRSVKPQILGHFLDREYPVRYRAELQCRLRMGNHYQGGGACFHALHNAAQRFRVEGSEALVQDNHLGAL